MTWLIDQIRMWMCKHEWFEYTRSDFVWVGSKLERRDVEVVTECAECGKIKSIIALR